MGRWKGSWRSRVTVGYLLDAKHARIRGEGGSFVTLARPLPGHEGTLWSGDLVRARQSERGIWFVTPLTSMDAVEQEHCRQLLDDDAAAQEWPESDNLYGIQSPALVFTSRAARPEFHTASRLSEF